MYNMLIQDKYQLQVRITAGITLKNTKTNLDPYCKSCILKVLLDQNYALSNTSQSIIAHLVANGEWLDGI
jgi:hypothetical protein